MEIILIIFQISSWDGALINRQEVAGIPSMIECKAQAKRVNAIDRKVAFCTEQQLQEKGDTNG